MREKKPLPEYGHRPAPPGGVGCKHNYTVLTNNLEVTTLNSRLEDNHLVEGLVLFYCTKCLDVEEVIFP